MRICCYTDTFFPLVGGAEMVLHHLCSQLVAAQDEVSVLAPKIERNRNTTAPSPTYRIYRYRKPFSKRFGVRFALTSLARVYANERFDLLHCHAAYPQAFVAATLRRWTGIPMVVRPHGNDILPNGRIRQHPRLERRLRSALNQADAVVAQGSFLKQILIEQLGVDPRCVWTIHNGIDLEPFSHWSRFPHPRPFALALGNLIPRKGFDLLLQAYARIPQPKPDLIIAGDGPESSRLREQASSLGIHDQVRFLGFVEGQSKVDLYRSASFFVCPSRMEPFGNVLLEASAAGLPIIASAVGGNTELVAHQERGLLVPNEEINALAEAMQSLIQDPEWTRTMGMAAEGFVRQFAWPQVAQQYRSLYQSIVRPSPHPSH